VPSRSPDDAELAIGGGASAVTPEAKVKASVKFTRNHSNLCRAPGHKIVEVANPVTFGKQVYNLEPGNHHLMTYMVYALMIVEEGYFVGSDERGTELELEGSTAAIRDRQSVRGAHRYQEDRDTDVVRAPQKGQDRARPSSASRS